MTTKNKTLCVIGGIVGSIALVNHCIFLNSKNKIAPVKAGRYYHSKYGKVHYITAGSGRPLLLVHGIGIGESYEEWRESIEYLSKKYKVYAIDLLGFGGSDKPKITYTAYLYVQLIKDFVENLINEQAHVVASGTSAAFVVLAQAFNGNLFDKIMLISPSGAGSYKNIATNSHRLFRMLLDTPLLGTAIYNYLARKSNIKTLLGQKFYSKQPEKDVVKKHYNNAHADGVSCKYPINSFLSNYLNMDIEKPLSEIGVPVHIIWGEKDIQNPVSNLMLIQRLSDNISGSVFEKTGALPHVENYTTFHKTIKRFFG